MSQTQTTPATRPPGVAPIPAKSRRYRRYYDQSYTHLYVEEVTRVTDAIRDFERRLTEAKITFRGFDVVLSVPSAVTLPNGDCVSLTKKQQEGLEREIRLTALVSQELPEEAIDAWPRENKSACEKAGYTPDMAYEDLE